MAKSQSDSSRVRQDQPESIISGARIFSHYCGILLFSKANVRSNISVRSPLFVRASGGRTSQSNGLRPSAPRRRRQAMRKFPYPRRPDINLPPCFQRAAPRRSGEAVELAVQPGDERHRDALLGHLHAGQAPPAEVVDYPVLLADLPGPGELVGVAVELFAVLLQPSSTNLVGMGNPEEQPKERWPAESTTAATWRFR